MKKLFLILLVCVIALPSCNKKKKQADEYEKVMWELKKQQVEYDLYKSTVEPFYNYKSTVEPYY